MGYRLDIWDVSCYVGVLVVFDLVWWKFLGDVFWFFECIVIGGYGGSFGFVMGFLEFGIELFRNLGFKLKVLS